MTTPPGTRGDIIPKGYKAGQLQQFTPEQQQLFSQLFGHVGPGSYLSKLAGGDEETFRQIEGPSMRQFNELAGGLASRFSGMGSTGARRSSGFQNVGGQLTSDFASNLASQRQQLQRQALMDLMGISESLLGQRPVEKFITKRQPSFWEQLAINFGGGLGKGLGASVTGGFGGLGGLFGGGGGSSGNLSVPDSVQYPSTSGKFGLPTYLGM